MRFLLLIFISLLSITSFAQFTHDDTLRGSETPERIWWNLKHYDLILKVFPSEKKISGSNSITFDLVRPQKKMQVDLQLPLIMDSVVFENAKLKFTKDGANAHLIEFPKELKIRQDYTVTCYYSGFPKEAIRAPWDGGIVWNKDKNGKPIIATACQGIGASIWWPCKDHMYDEPENGMQISVNTPKEVMNVSNGRLIENRIENDGTRTTVWEVKNPINNYGVNMNVADYATWSEVYAGEKGLLDMTFYVYAENLEKAKVHFKDATRTMEAFEHWFGPYPFYEDSYKLVEVPYLGMEHQSSVTYGNKFMHGYLGSDLSGTGWGKKWDYIIVHESGHEWFANSITYRDAADMWLHEGFTSYSEGLFVEYFYGKDAGAEYLRGLRSGISNKSPIIGTYNVNQEGSGDMYPKGANLLHTIRQMVNNDSIWRSFLRNLNKDFYHQIVTSKRIESYMSMKLQMDLSSVFDQYLRTTDIPTLVIQKKGKKLEYKWTNVVQDFTMAIEVCIDGKAVRIVPTEYFLEVKCKKFEISPDYYIKISK